MSQDNSDSWVKKATEDLGSAKVILENQGGYASTVCFLSQQSAEKFLKAFLVNKGGRLAKVHDLLQLESLISEVHAAVSEIHEDLVYLNRFYIETRYPGDFPDFSWDEAKEAFSRAKNIERHTLKYMSS